MAVVGAVVDVAEVRRADRRRRANVIGVGVAAAVALALAALSFGAAGVSPDRVLAVLPTIDSFDIGIMAPIDFTKSNTTAVPGFTRLFNTKFFFNKIEGGILVPLADEPVDVLPAS